MDLDYSPTGQEIVTGSYDRTLRIFKSTSGHSREIYHTKRMQRIFAVKYSMDSKYVLSGSDDGNIRLWKADASEKLGPVCVIYSLLVFFYLFIIQLTQLFNYFRNPPVNPPQPTTKNKTKSDSNTCPKSVVSIVIAKYPKLLKTLVLLNVP